MDGWDWMEMYGWKDEWDGIELDKDEMRRDEMDRMG